MKFLKIENLKIDLGEFFVHIDKLHLNKGDHLVIVGPTGSGKSVLLETIMGFFEPCGGLISVNGKNLLEFPPENRGVSIIYQDHCLFPHMTVEENIKYGFRKNMDDKYKFLKFEKIVDIIGISHLLHRYPNTLSGGESQRVAIARALIVNPSLFLMDEPLSALDHITKMSIRKLILDIKEKFGTTIIHVTHDLDDVVYLSNKVAIMKDGEILQVGKTNDVINRPSSHFVKNFFSSYLKNEKEYGKTKNKILLKEKI
ncbi:ATP-binding cassette domain-containing protein [Methanothermobacter wolfeii]|uniref:ATP-binding cassette domain-containing protein n=1 Tax=Methanothermobacter wolfeii TaxID=145261 RepID=UPI0024B33DCF|nr:ATP-binding cassette domain-containing protein [Methanothermobacter wolfeii]MDI6703009.1 ATP-binding cassette domain-containing protein [Methanothermobacter wolfeii]